MTVLVGALLVSLALVDGAFSGFRASLGRTGLVDHRVVDRRAALRGSVLSVGLAVPAVTAFSIDTTFGGEPPATYVAAGRTFLVSIAPYAVVMLLTIAAYAATTWERRYLASALILGPFTLIRPLVALAAAAYALTRHPDLSVSVAAALALVGVLLVEPLRNPGEAKRAAEARA